MTNPSEIARDFLTAGRSDSCPVIDMHAHYGPYLGIYFPQPEAEGMLRTMDRCGVECAVMSGHHALAEPAAGNEEIEHVVRDHPGRFFGYRVVNPHDPDQVARQIERFPQASGFVGFKFHPSWHAYRVTDPGYVPGLEYAQEHRLLVLSHTWGNREYDNPRMFDDLAASYPDVTFLLAHGGYGDWEAAIEVAGKHDNVYIELTAVYEVGGYVEKAVREIGSEQIVFGDDLPWFDPHYGIGCICFARVADEDRHNILHRNAERLLAPFRPASA